MDTPAPENPTPQLNANPGKADFVVPKKDNVTKSVLLTVGIALVIAGVVYAGLLVQQNFEVKDLSKKGEQQLRQQAQKQREGELAQLDATRKANLTEVKNALEEYRKDNDLYPEELAKLVPNYLSRVPFDPKTKKEYTYSPSVDQKSFELKATLNSGEEYKVESD